MISTARPVGTAKRSLLRWANRSRAAAFGRGRANALVWSAARLIAVWLTLLILSVGMPAPGRAAESMLRVGCYHNPPLSLVGADQLPQGFFIDLLEGIAAEENRRLDFQLYSWNDCLPDLSDGRLDLLGAIAYTPERAALFDFNRETVITEWGRIDAAAGVRIDSLLDLDGRCLAVLRGDRHAHRLREMVDQFGLTCRFLETADYRDVFGLLDRGECEAGLVSQFFGSHHERSYNVRITPIVLSPQRLYFAAPKDRHPALLERIDQALVQLKHDKESPYYQALDKWFGLPARSVPPRSMVWILTTALALLAVFLVLNLLLRARVRARTKELKANNSALLEAIEQHKQRAERLRESEAKFRFLIENIQDGVFIIQDGRFAYVNEALARMLGYREEELIGQPGAMPVAPEHRALVQEPQRRRLEGAEVPTQFDIHLLTKGDNRRLIATLHVGVGRLQGRPALFGTVKDTTASRRAQDLLIQSEERYRRMFEAAVLGIFQIKVDGEILNVNPAFARMFGYPDPESLLRSGIRAEQLHAEPGERASLVAQIVESAGPNRFQRDYRRRDGSIFHANLHVWPIHDQDGRLLYLEGFIEDITAQQEAEVQRQKLEQQLRQAHKMEAVGTLAGGIAHDFNNLLQAVQGYAELLLAAGDPRERRPLEQILRAAQRGRDLTGQLLTFSRKVESRRAPLDLNQLVISVRTLLERTIPKMIRIELDLADPLDPINADAGQIEQVLMNLALNAKDAMAEGGTLRIQTRRVNLERPPADAVPPLPAGDYVRLSVADTGEGIALHVQPHIFDPFFTTKEVGKGTGLGLAIVHGIVKSHDGAVVCSSRPDQGTRFDVYLPTLPATISAEPAQIDGALEGGSETLLLIDDEDVVREFGEEMLSQFGYRVLSAASGEAGLEIFRDHRGAIDLVILDLIMPGMGGKRCLKALLELDPKVRILVASGFTADDSVADLATLGACDVIQKPYDFRRLLTTVRRLLDQGGPAPNPEPDSADSRPR